MESATLEITMIKNGNHTVYRIAPRIPLFDKYGAFIKLSYSQEDGEDHWLPQVQIPTNAEMEGGKLNVIINLSKYFAPPGFISHTQRFLYGVDWAIKKSREQLDCVGSVEVRLPLLFNPKEYFKRLEEELANDGDFQTMLQ